MIDNAIYINIWDDYYDDGYVPDGEVQHTYAYVESAKDLEVEDCKNILANLKKNIESLLKPEWSLELSVEFYDSAKIYPELIGTKHEHFLYKRWQLEMKHLPHDIREYLVEEFAKKQLQYLERPMIIYSES